MNIRTATILIIVTILLASSFLFYGLSIRDQVDTFQNELDKYMALTTESLTSGIEFSLEEDNYESAYQSMYYTQTQEDVIVSALIFKDEENTTIDVVIPEDFDGTYAYIESHIAKDYKMMESDTLFKLTKFSAGDVNGEVLVGFTTKNIKDQIKESSFYTFIRLIIFVVIGVIIALVFSNSIVSPINKLIEVSQKITKGDTKVRANTKKGGKDIKLLANNYNLMLDKLEQLQKQRFEELSSYNATLEFKNEQILSSIRYASTIQNAILPKENILDLMNISNFILYKPKDIISGDFYWFESVGENVIIIAADCTGHGVPGAMISMMGNMILNDLILRGKNTDPANILHKLDQELIKSLGQDSEDSFSQDGMDIGIAVFDASSMTLTFAGASRPLYIVKDNTLEEIKGDRLHIGGLHRKLTSKSFTNHLIKLEKDQQFYLTTDGFGDQIGKKSKKFGSKNLKKLIETLDVPLANQKDILYNKFIEHKGNEDQRDDITLLGFKFI